MFAYVYKKFEYVYAKCKFVMMINNRIIIAYLKLLTKQNFFYLINNIVIKNDVQRQISYYIVYCNIYANY